MRETSGIIPLKMRNKQKKMNKLKLFLIFAMFLIALPSVFSDREIMGNITFASQVNITNNGCTFSGSVATCSGGQSLVYSGRELINISRNRHPTRIIMYNLTLTATGSAQGITIAGGNNTGSGDIRLWSIQSVGTTLQVRLFDNPDTDLPFSTSGNAVYSEFWIDYLPLNDSFNITGNGTYLGNIGFTGGNNGYGNETWFKIWTQAGMTVSLGGFAEINGTQTPAGEPPPTIINNTIPIITISYPSANNTVINNNTMFPLIINGTVSIQNGTIANLTINSTNFKNFGNASFFNFTMNGTLPEGNYIFNISVNSTAGNRSSAIITFTYDITTPNLASSINNNRSLIYAYQNLTFQINYSDNFRVYSFNVSTPEGFLFNISGINTTNYIYNGSINVSTYGIGRHNITTEVCDAHTKNKIDKWDYIRYETSKKIKFNFGNAYLSIEPENPNLIEYSDTIKLTDRYIFRFVKKDKIMKDYSFIVSSSEKIDILGQDKYYKGWLVIPKLKKWVDFNLKNNPNAEYEIIRIDDYNIKISVSNIQNDIFEFESAGDLNCVSNQIIYYIFNYTASFSASAIETTIENFKLIIDFKDISLKGNGSLNYSNVIYNLTNLTSINQLNLTLNLNIPQISGNESNASFFWNFILNDSSFRTINYSQLITRIRLIVCGSGDIPTLNISIFNEQSTTNYLEASIDSIFSVWTNNSGNTLNFTFHFEGNTNYSICIYPNTTINTNAFLVYNTSGGFTQRWYLKNAKLTNNVSILYIYNFDTQTGISTLKGIVRSQSFDVFPSIISKMQRRYVAENLWRTIQMDESDQFGLTLFHVIEETTEYRLVFEKDGAEYDRTNNIKFKCTGSLCSLDFVIINRTRSLSAALGLAYAYDNNSQMFQLNFSDANGLTSSVRLRITQDLANQSINVCDTTLSSSSGTINCNTTGYTGTLTVRIYSSGSPEIAKIAFQIFKRTIQQLYELIDKKETLFWAMGISTTLTIAGFLFTPIAGIILYIVSLLGVSFLGIANFVSITFVSIMAVLGITLAILLKRRQ